MEEIRGRNRREEEEEEKKEKRERERERETEVVERKIGEGFGCAVGRRISLS